MTATREKTFLLARPEARVLEWIARRLPRWVMPDHLTALGVLAAIGIAAAYVLSNRDPLWLWAASGLLVVHWLGDSLDGTLARVRRTERPRYGYYLDHLVDAVATALIGIGLGLSPHMLLVTGLVIVIAYLVLSINTYLETQRARRVLARLRAARPDRGADRPDRGERGARPRPGAVVHGRRPRARRARRRSASRWPRSCSAGLAVRVARNLRELARLEPAGQAAP